MVQIAVSAALLAAIAKLLNPTELERLFRDASPFWLATAFAILVAQQLLTAERWRLVASVLSVPPHTFSFYIFWQGIGSLCGMILPPIIGADLVRTYALSRRTIFSTVIRVILVDRTLGLLALAALVIIAFVVAPLFFINHDIMLFPVLIAVVGIAIYLVLTRGFPTLRSANVAVLAGQRLGADLKQVVEGRGQGWCITASFAIHVLSCGSFLVLGHAIGLTGVEPLDYLKVVPAALLVTVIPFSIGGWGLRETSVIIGFGLIGVRAEQAFALSVTFGVLSLIAAFVPAVAGLYWFFEKPRDELIEVFAEQVEN
ncbi:MAG TPA: lysylphosphatidylglycerol synthase transmembrane domain-containing protein [Xanthobacteraceae bacterium]|nr:lysylphosphatidylglycerol synthase transmembrane domain-containing protein [Xanthobacteraceae bacterium]